MRGGGRGECVCGGVQRPKAVLGFGKPLHLSQGARPGPVPSVPAVASPGALRSHQVLVVEEAEEGGGEEAGSDPPGEEGEQTAEEQGAEDCPKAAKGHRQLSHGRRSADPCQIGRAHV